jgi:hypothetical protein
VGQIESSSQGFDREIVHSVWIADEDDAAQGSIASVNRFDRFQRDRGQQKRS